jgi:hypothetical protein
MPLLTLIPINCNSISCSLLWLNLWFSILDSMRVQYEKSVKNDVLVQLAAGSTERSEVYNCLKPINPTPLLYLPHTSRSRAIEIRYLNSAITLQTAHTIEIIYLNSAITLQTAHTIEIIYLNSAITLQTAHTRSVL